MGAREFKPKPQALEAGAQASERLSKVRLFGLALDARTAPDILYFI